jgi:hypothetical protein
MKCLLTFLVPVLLSCGCTETAKQKPADENTYTSRLAQLSWLLGSWIQQTEDGLITESWEPGNKGELKAISIFTPANGEASVLEEIRIVSENDTL